MRRVRGNIKRFQYFSDLHLEIRNYIPHTPVLSRTLVLAGDIGNPFKPNYREYLTYCSYNHEHTILISGNHEYWNKHGVEKTDEEIRTITEKLPNVYYLQRDTVEFDNMCFMGCTLWSNILKPPFRRIGDDRRIYTDNGLVDWNVLNRFHSRDLAWLRKELEKYQGRQIIVVTHHLPTYQLVHPMYHKFNHKDRFYSDLEYLIKPPIIGWVGGHSHCKIRINLGGIYLMINAIGYSGEKLIGSYDETFDISLKQ